MKPSQKLPQKFTERIAAQLGNSASEFLEAITHTEPITSIRLNPTKPTLQFDEAPPVPWAKHGRYLESRPSFAADPLIFAGAYYVQEASSMFLEMVMQHALPLATPLRVLDLCAAPGGKSTLLLSILSEDSLLVSNELMRNRLPSLVENLTRWGHHNSVVTSGEAVQFRSLPQFFDALVIDAPCSGEGMFRKDSKAISMWSEGLVQSCSATQRQILDEALPALKEGGTLVYSTCTFAPQENEEILQWLSEKEAFESVRIPLPLTSGIVEETVNTPQGTFYGYRFYFHKVKGEGFFMACFRKQTSVETPPKPKKTKKKGSGSGQRLQFLPKKYNDGLRQWLKNPEELLLILDDDILRVLPHSVKKEAEQLYSALPYKRLGLEAGKFRKGELVPAHSLALSSIVAETIPRIALSYEEAIRYLRKEEIILADSPPKGWVLMCYQGLALGWAKVLPNRINNYYPTEMRLRKDVLS